jgi:hypothetical protein
MAGLPSGLIQICDLIASKPIKQAFKTRYVSWKIESDPGPGGRYKVDRKDGISWLEQSIEDVNESISRNSMVSKSFIAYGQDFRREDQTELLEHLAKHEENGVYQSLLRNQQVISLD